MPPPQRSVTTWCSAQRHQAVQVHQTRNRGRHHREQSEGVPVGLAQTTKGFKPPNAMRDVHADRGLLPIGRVLLRRQLSAAGLALGHRHPGRTHVRQISLLEGSRKLLRDGTAFIAPVVRRRPRVARLQCEQLPGGVAFRGRFITLPETEDESL